ncbi:unnamed protein product [Larinioides sclopetarius]|uniref:Uncharacterized protein n=1 Tax=Larinioides sclopetarius TaxID=280406 RepID=A0AAV1Z051_9ARAC
MSPNKISSPAMICIVIISVILSTAVCQVDNETETSTGSANEVTLVSTTVKPPVNVSCETHNNDCKGCVSNSDCYYCETDGVCYFKITKILSDEKCNLKKIHYLTCRGGKKELKEQKKFAKNMVLLKIQTHIKDLMHRHEMRCNLFYF